MSRVKVINSSLGGGQKSGPAIAGMAGTAPTALTWGPQLNGFTLIPWSSQGSDSDPHFYMK